MKYISLLLLFLLIGTVFGAEEEPMDISSIPFVNDGETPQGAVGLEKVPFVNESDTPQGSVGIEEIPFVSEDDIIDLKEKNLAEVSLAKTQSAETIVQYQTKTQNSNQYNYINFILFLSVIFGLIGLIWFFVKQNKNN
jgi:hypothetical protein